MKLGYINYGGVIAGLILLIGSVLALYSVWRYYKKLSDPWKDLAGRSMVSLFFFMLGSAGVVADSLTERKLWEIMAVSYTLSYLAIFSTVFLALRVAREERGSTAQKREASLGNAEDVKLPVTGGYAVRKELSPLTLHILKMVSRGLIVISRTPRKEWAEKFKIEPEEFLWLSRVEGENSIDPFKLHVLQGRVLNFMKGKDGISVYFEGIEYLPLYNDFSSVAKFLFALKDAVMINDSLLIINIPRGIFDKKQEALILREFKEISEERLVKELSRALSLEKAQEILLFGALPPTTKRQEGKDAGDKSSKREGGNSKEKA